MQPLPTLAAASTGVEALVLEIVQVAIGKGRFNLGTTAGLISSTSLWILLAS
jgi:hypothetical protein